jgi:hypothetical protein
VGAGFCESPPNALDGPYVEPLADERVQRDPGCDDVAACVLPGELDLVEHFAFDECEFVAAAGPAEGASSLCISVTHEAAAWHRHRSVDLREWCLRRRGNPDPGHRSDTGCVPVRRLGRKMQIKGRQHPSGHDPCAVRVRVGRVEPDAGRRSEHQDDVSAIGTVNDRNPFASPVEGGRVGDRDESEVAFR